MKKKEISETYDWIARKDFYLEGKLYKEGKPVKVKDETTIIRLKEKGFIQQVKNRKEIEI